MLIVPIFRVLCWAELVSLKQTTQSVMWLIWPFRSLFTQISNWWNLGETYIKTGVMILIDWLNTHTCFFCLWITNSFHRRLAKKAIPRKSTKESSFSTCIIFTASDYGNLVSVFFPEKPLFIDGSKDRRPSRRSIKYSDLEGRIL